MTQLATVDRRTQAQTAVGELRKAFHDNLRPTVVAFIDDEIGAGDFHSRFQNYYQDAVALYDQTLKSLWHADRGTDVGVQPGPPDTTDADVDLLAYYPASISHHNLNRLVDVLQLELGDHTASHTQMPQRIYDLAAVTDSLERLLDRLAGE